MGGKKIEKEKCFAGVAPAVNTIGKRTMSADSILTFDEAREAILREIAVLPPEEQPLLKALGQTMVEDIRAQINVPGWDSSARDGFAVRAEDVRGATPQNPVILRVIETVMAGSDARRPVVSGTAIRIMTGAPLPPGADCVVQFEDTDEALRDRNETGAGRTEIGIQKEEKTGANILPAGGQIPKGSSVIARGRIVGPGEINLLASLGQTRVKVVRRPVAAIIATGQELVSPGRTLVKPQIYVGNSSAIAAQVVKCGGIPRILGIARDNKASIIAKIRRASSADLIITTGGVSRGDRDLVKDILATLGTVVFRQVGMTPGEYSTFALIEPHIPHFALSGNPPASLIAFEVLVRPALLKMLGRKDLDPPLIEATLEEPLRNERALRRFIWATLEVREGLCYARPTGSRTQGALNSIAMAEGLAILPETQTRAERGDKIQVRPLNWH
jgi:molybdopterin molybdotransferase